LKTFRTESAFREEVTPIYRAVFVAEPAGLRAESFPYLLKTYPNTRNSPDRLSYHRIVVISTFFIEKKMVIPHPVAS
jgi:hypothetical protein